VDTTRRALHRLWQTEGAARPTPGTTTCAYLDREGRHRPGGEMIEAKDVAKRYGGKLAAHGLSFTVRWRP
jgi:hypothetical protein